MNADSQFNYAINMNTDNSVRSIQRQDNTNEIEIPLNPEDQSFCDFLTWVSRHPDSIPPHWHSIPRNSHFFSDMTRFCEFCKSHSLTLYVDEESSVDPVKSKLRVDHQFSLEIIRKPLNTQFIQLNNCVAQPSPEWSELNGIIPGRAPVYVTQGLLHILDTNLENQSSEVRCLSSWTVERAFVYCDVSDFSRFAPGQQVLVIKSLISIIENKYIWNAPEVSDASGKCEASLCIGDGYIFVFKNAVHATVFGSHLAQLIETFAALRRLPVEFHFRIGIHVGPVFRFWDIGRKDWNYIGEGINGGQRVLSAMGKDLDDVVFISSAVQQKIIAETTDTTFSRQMRSALQNRGRHSDKHGNSWRIYLVNHESLFGVIARHGASSWNVLGPG